MVYRKVLVDVNVFEDVLSGREGLNFSAEILQLVKKGKIEGWVSANTYGILYYLQRRRNSENVARRNVTKILKNFVVIPIRKNILSQALQSSLPDFEDNIQIESAAQFNMDAIITRNIKDFKNSKIPAYTPEEFLEIFSGNLKKSISQSNKILFLDLKAQFNKIYNEIDNEITNIISNTGFIKGKAVEKFEEQFAEKLNAKYCIGVGNGTDALIIALKTLGISNGDEVITVANTFIATSEAISAVGAKVVFVDANPKTYNIDVTKIEEKITPRTKAIIAVHLYGQPADMNEIMKIAKKYGLFVIEDSAQAHLAEYKLNGKWQKVGTIGDIGTFSFYPGKNLGAYGDAGAIVTNNKELAIKARMFANHGRISKYNHEFEGLNSRLDGIQAAVLSVKLKHLDEWTKLRRQHAAQYIAGLSGIKDVQLPYEPPENFSVYHLFVIKTRFRDELKSFLESNGIYCGIHYPIGLPFLPAYRYLGYTTDDFPVTAVNQNQVLSLPMFPELKKEQIDFVVRTIKKFFESKNEV